MKVFLNLLAGITGGQITRARAFLDRFDLFMPDSQIVIVKNEGVLCDYLSTPNRHVINVPIRNGRFKTLQRMWWENTAIPRLVSECSADVYLTFSHYLPSGNRISVPTVVGVSNLAPFSDEAWSHESLIVKMRMAVLKRTIISSAKRADSVLALSEACRDLLVKYGVPDDRIRVTPNGVDDFWSEEAPSSGILDRLGVVRPFFLYVSHFYRYKNHLRLVEAYAMLPPEIRRLYQLVLVGKPYDNLYYKQVIALIHRLCLTDDVIVVPGEGRESLREMYQKASLFIFPTLIENCPNILLEAMKAGAPVAVSNLQPMPEFCDDAAIYFNPLDVSDIATGIEEVLGSADCSETPARQSKSQADLFTWDAFTCGVVESISQVAKPSAQ